MRVDGRSIPAAVVVRILLVVAVVTAGSCVSSRHATNPAPAAPDHRVASNATPNDCPDLTGTYTNTGQLAEDTPPEICETSSPNYEWVLDWLCDARLSGNLGDKLSAAPVVRIEQPDSGTLIAYTRASGTYKAVFQRGEGDFDCDAGVLKTSESGVDRVQWGDSSTGDETGFQRNFSRFQSALGVLVFSGGYKSLRREYYKSREGALVMKITRSGKGLSTAIPVIKTYSTFVTWSPATPDEIAASRRAVPPAPPTDGGLVYFYREPKVGVGNVTVRVSTATSPGDGTLVTLTEGWEGSCFPLTVPAGRVEAQVDYEQPGQAVTLDVVAGATYFVKVESVIGWAAPRAELSVIEADDAREGIARSGCLK